MEVRFNHVKRTHLSVVIGRFQSILFVSVFSMLPMAIIVIDGSKNEFHSSHCQSSHVSENRNNNWNNNEDRNAPIAAFQRATNSDT